MRPIISIFLFLLLATTASAQNADTLQCSNNAGRNWWDVQHYDINLNIDTGTGKLQGFVVIDVKVNANIGDYIQIDLQKPLKLRVALAEDTSECMLHKFEPEDHGDYYILRADFKKIIKSGSFVLKLYYEGIPKIAARPPWDGGLVISRDNKGLPWIAMACQGTGASIWFPCKNFQGDEADSGMTLSMVLPANLKMIGNGRKIEDDLNYNQEIDNISTPFEKLNKKKERHDGNLRWTWSVSNPINNYDISFYIGDYVHWSDTLLGVKGPLSLDYYALRENETKAKEHFKVVKPMLQCFEAKMGPYPFYEDGYKLVEAPYLGMEHQSAVAYGNKYKMGYEGIDRSKSGVGLLFDFIIVHESGHEWFGNSITSYDVADEWIHEGFTSYTETIFAECLLGKQKAFDYQQGKINTIRNDKPVQGRFNECDEGSSDHYDKAAFMIHMIRMVVNNDSTFFAMLKEMNNVFYHQIITGKEMEQFINGFTGKNFDKVFDQYLRVAALPKLEIQQTATGISYRWINCVPGFDMPILIHPNGGDLWLHPTTKLQYKKMPKGSLTVDKNFLIQ